MVGTKLFTTKALFLLLTKSHRPDQGKAPIIVSVRILQELKGLLETQIPKSHCRYTVLGTQSIEHVINQLQVAKHTLSSILTPLVAGKRDETGPSRGTKVGAQQGRGVWPGGGWETLLVLSCTVDLRPSLLLALS